MAGYHAAVDYVESGEGNPVLFLPGMEGAKEFWAPQAEALGDRYRAIACSLPVRKPRLSSAIGDYALDVVALMDSLDLPKAVVVGESFGGMVAQELAIYHPERVAGIILCNTMDRLRRGYFGLNMFTLACLVHNLAFLPFLTMEQRKSILRWVSRHRGFVLDSSPGNDDLIEYIIAYGTACGAPTYLDRVIAGARLDYIPRLRDIDVSTLVLRGEEDRLVAAETILSLVGGIPHAELALIEGGGHCCTHTVTDASSRAILEWLEHIGY
ncbi:MAG: alpha/beta hydrolase [Actinomycetota bacterium]|nr:alpha/beta hydrolase [Actinomycetota bacterium]